MEGTLEFFFDYGSPFSYLADTQLAGVARRAGATVSHRPMLLGAVLKATGNSSPMTVPAKAAYMGRELERWAKRYGVPFAPNPFSFRSNTLRLMRGATASLRLGVFEPFHRAVFEAVWGDPRDLGEEAVLRGVLSGAGVDPDRLLRTIDEEDTKSALRRTTDEAVERGVFGAPTFFVGTEMFWGNDRLDWVEESLRRALHPKA